MQNTTLITKHSKYNMSISEKNDKAIDVTPIMMRELFIYCNCLLSRFGIL